MSLIIIFVNTVLFVLAIIGAYHIFAALDDKINAKDEFVVKPWGGYRNLADGDKYKVKILIIDPDESTSLQSHEYREELWMIAQGNIEIDCSFQDNTRKYNLKTGEYMRVLREFKHRITNNGTEPAVIIEVWLGDILKEEDIIRYEDKYGRV